MPTYIPGTTKLGQNFKKKYKQRAESKQINTPPHEWGSWVVIESDYFCLFSQKMLHCIYFYPVPHEDPGIANITFLGKKWFFWISMLVQCIFGNTMQYKCVIFAYCVWIQPSHRSKTIFFKLDLTSLSSRISQPHETLQPKAKDFGHSENGWLMT